MEDTDFEGEPPAERTEEVCDALVRALTGDADKAPAFRRLWTSPTRNRQPPTMPRCRHVSVLTIPRRIDSRSSPSSPTIDAACSTRSPARCFELGLEVHVAKIGTYLDQVVDAFYVTDTAAENLQPDPTNEIRHKLEEAARVAAVNWTAGRFASRGRCDHDLGTSSGRARL